MTTEKLAAERDRVTIAGVAVDRITMEATLAQIERWIEAGETQQIVTADASMIVDAQDDAELREIIARAGLVTPDSSGVLWASRKFGKTIDERVSGVDIVDAVCGLSAQKGYRLYFLGAEPGVTDMAAERLRLKHPGCNIVGTRHGFFPASDDAVVAQEVSEAQPDILFVAMGIPRQEKFIAKQQALTGANVAVGVGGSFDVYSGKTKRAPVICQRLRIEWLWRLLLNPSKWRKTLKLPQFVALVGRSKK